MMNLSVFAHALLLASTAEPCTVPELAHTMPVEQGVRYTAKVYLPCDGEDAGQLLETLMAREDEPLQVQESFQDEGITLLITSLETADDNSKSVFLSMVSPRDGVEPWVCHVTGVFGVESNANKAFAWCMSYVVGSGWEDFAK